MSEIHEQDVHALNILVVNAWRVDLIFEKEFGNIGEGFIHVHHIKPISEVGAEYQIDPVRDLVPVCPNCHAMLHWHSPPFSIEELKDRRLHQLRS